VGYRTKPVGDSATIVYLDESYKRDAFVQLVGEVSAIAVKGRPNIILNMARLPAITSEGIGLLVLVNDKCREAGGKLVLCDVPDRVAYVIKLAGLTRFFDDAGSEENAVKLISSAAPEPQAQGEAAEGAAAESAAGPEVSEEDKVKDIITTTIKSRLHQRLVEALGSRSFKTAALADIAEMIGADRERAAGVCRDLVARAVLKTEDNEIFTFAPEGPAQQSLETFRRAWGNPRFRTRIMAWLYSEEKKPR
jgi:anti-anti-sigma factor